jgi:DNA-binding transcriptional regulator YhcF (GntR family)
LLKVLSHHAPIVRLSQQKFTFHPIFCSFRLTQAVIAVEPQPGRAFPSVRTLAALKIHPNTAHKVVQHLIRERLLEVRPGIGTVVAEPPAARAGDRARLEVWELTEAIEAQWENSGGMTPSGG